MIKINLRNQKKKSKVQTKEKGSVSQENVLLNSDEIKKEALRKVLIILIFPICLMLYESLVVPDQEETVKTQQTKLKEAKDFISKNSQVADAIKKMQMKENLLSLKITEIEKKVIDKNTRIQMLDLIQQLVPEKVWLSKVAEANSIVSLAGFAVNDTELNTFFDSISKSIFFVDANIVNSNEVNLDGTNFKKFEMTFKIGGKSE